MKEHIQHHSVIEDFLVAPENEDQRPTKEHGISDLVADKKIVWIYSHTPFVTCYHRKPTTYTQAKIPTTPKTHFYYAGDLEKTSRQCGEV